mmetsp:Transcript_99755/g.257920  ORF Transcript_99755/g.257920 Transcript_99755/m.257920 type:complete len:128 (+) Transcript_99755:130-513(+)
MRLRPLASTSSTQPWQTCCIHLTGENLMKNLGRLRSLWFSDKHRSSLARSWSSEIVVIENSPSCPDAGRANSDVHKKLNVEVERCRLSDTDEKLVVLGGTITHFSNSTFGSLSFGALCCQTCLPLTP